MNVKMLPALFLFTMIILLSYFFIDLPTAIYFYSFKGTPLYEAAHIITEAGDSIYYLVPSLLIYLYYRKRNPGYGKISLFIFSSTAISGILVDILKVIFGRFRPKMYFKEQMYGFDWFQFSSPMLSFPSGHSATAMGVSLAFALLLPKYRIVFLLFGILIASTRIILTAHYVGDVFAGSTIGILVTLTLYHYFFPNQTKDNALKPQKNS